MKNVFKRIVKIFISSEKTTTHKIIKILGVKFNFRLSSKTQNNYGDNVVIIDKSSKDKVILDLNGCHNNKIKIGKISPSSAGKIILSCYCENCEIVIGDGFYISQTFSVACGLNRSNGGKIENTKLIVGSNVSCESVYVNMRHSNSSVTIGNDCLISFGIQIWNTDAHPIFSKEGKIINYAKYIDIGNHCWIGGNSTILKNTKIAPNSIVGWGSVVRGNFEKEGSVIIGNPATAINSSRLEGISWQTSVTKEFIDNKLETLSKID